MKTVSKHQDNAKLVACKLSSTYPTTKSRKAYLSGYVANRCALGQTKVVLLESRTLTDKK